MVLIVVQYVPSSGYEPIIHSSHCRMSHAAKAFESCERSFKAVFADPKPQRQIHAPPHLKFEQESFTPMTTSAPSGHIGLGIPTPGMHAFDFLPHNTGD